MRDGTKVWVDRWLLSNRIILIFLHINTPSAAPPLSYYQRLTCTSDFTMSSLFPLRLITVISELEGLSRGIKPLTSASGIIVSGGNTPMTTQTAVNSSRTIGNRSDPQHAAFVAKASKEALEFLKSTNSSVKYEKKLTRFHRKHI